MNFTNTCIGGWIERPFTARGDASHVIYRLRCVVAAGDYATLALSTTLTNTAAAGVQALPASVGPNAGAYFIGDTEPNLRGDSPLVEYVRSFATVPATYTSVEGATNYTYPEMRQWYNFDASDQVNFDANLDVNVPPVLLRAAQTLEVPVKTVRSYAYSANGYTGLSTDTPFSITQDDFSKTYNSVTSYKFEQQNVNYLCNNTTVISYLDYKGTTPSQSTYAGKIGDTNEWFLISSDQSRYFGNIFVKTNLYVPYK